MDQTDSVIDALTEDELRSRMTSAEGELNRRIDVRVKVSAEALRNCGLGGSQDITVHKLISDAARRGLVLTLGLHDGRSTTSVPDPSGR